MKIRWTLDWMALFCFRAKMKLKVEPLPHWDLTQQSPPSCLAIILQIWRPSPTPLVFIALVESRNPKSLKSYDWSSILIPMPVSLTEIYIIPWLLKSFSSKRLWRSSMSMSDLFWINLHVILMDPPVGVNLRALDCRFKSICWSLLWSVHITRSFSSIWPSLTGKFSSL